jgi:hypothetical protein
MSETDPNTSELTVTPSISGGFHMYLDGKPVATVFPHPQTNGKRIDSFVKRLQFLWNEGRGRKTQFVTNPVAAE